MSLGTRTYSRVSFALMTFFGPNACLDAQHAEFTVTDLGRFEQPWALEFLPDGRLLLSEMEGAIKLLDGDGNVLGDVTGVPEVDHGGQGGFGDIVLQIENVSLSFGGVQALEDVSFDTREREIRAIIGPNGAGKSSMLNVINGFYHPQEGQITFKGETRKQMAPHHAASHGIARTFQNIALFKGMTTPMSCSINAMVVPN